MQAFAFAEYRKRVLRVARSGFGVASNARYSPASAVNSVARTLGTIDSDLSQLLPSNASTATSRSSGLCQEWEDS